MTRRPSSPGSRSAGRTSDHAERFALLESEIAAINKFPDQNPNPVMRLDRDGHLLYANPASEPVTAALGVAVGEQLASDRFAELTAAATATPPGVIELSAGRRTYALLPVRVPELDVLNLYGTDITAAKVVERFPDRNPNPVMRMDEDGRLIYANAASGPIVSALGIGLGDAVPSEVALGFHRSLEHGTDDPIEIQGDGRTYRLMPVGIPEVGFTNIYGTDVTATKALDKFPDRNPHPVMRLSQDGRLLYANPASAPVCRALEAVVGEPLAGWFFERVRAAVETGPHVPGRAADRLPDTIEIRSEGRVFELLVVAVFEFDFINLYGTDVTAAREVERLLLNILPASIADRLRHGEMVIADRFDEMTVLFADVVGFTELSQTLSPSEIVDTLNAVFSAFDLLADEFGLEKIKTIGDAYMVVGGLAGEGDEGAATTDHVERVARMGLDMLAEVARLASTLQRPLQIRIGMHMGPAVAGVIGMKKFIYDVWGDTVNTASRMESHGVPGRVQVTEAAYDRLRERFAFESRGLIEVKGKGRIPAYLLIGPTLP